MVKREVKLGLAEAIPARHRLGRIVGAVFAVPPRQTGSDLSQVKAGLAWWYRKYAQEQSPVNRQLYEAAEDQARADQAGLWTVTAPVPPWDWRKL